MVGALVSIGYGLVSHLYVYTNLKLLSSKFKIREERMERMSLVTKIALQRKGRPPRLLPLVFSSVFGRPPYCIITVASLSLYHFNV